MLGYNVPQLSINKNPLVAYHFEVTFFYPIPRTHIPAIPNVFDIRFQKVSGISAEITMNEIVEGGNTKIKQEAPGKMNYDNLVLERGVFLGSPLRLHFNTTFTFLKTIPTQILVMALDKNSAPVANWLLFNAYPVKWEISDFDANENEILIETMELSYQRYQYLSL